MKILLKSNSNSNKVIDACDSSGTFFFSLILIFCLVKLNPH